MKNLAKAYLLSAADNAHVDVRSGRGPWIFLIAHGADCEGCRNYADELVGARAQFGEWGARLAVVLHAPLEQARALHVQLEATGCREQEREPHPCAARRDGDRHGGDQSEHAAHRKPPRQ